MKTIASKYFGDIEYTDDSTVVFPEGIPGFEEQQGFLLVQQPQSRPLVFLQSLATPELCFLALPAQLACPDYRFELAAEDLEALGLPSGRQPVAGKEVLYLAIVSIDKDSSISANLLAPLVINLESHRGRQAILNGSGYSHRHPIEAPPCS